MLVEFQDVNSLGLIGAALGIQLIIILKLISEEFFQILIVVLLIAGASTIIVTIFIRRPARTTVYGTMLPVFTFGGNISVGSKGRGLL